MMVVYEHTLPTSARRSSWTIRSGGTVAGAISRDAAGWWGVQIVQLGIAIRVMVVIDTALGARHDDSDGLVRGPIVRQIRSLHVRFARARPIRDRVDRCVSRLIQRYECDVATPRKPLDSCGRRRS